MTTQSFVEKPKTRKTAVLFAAVITLVTAIKILLSQTFYGHSSDMSLFSAWADLGANEPLSAFYGEMGKSYYVDYPPLYLYVLTFVGKIAKLFSVPYGTDSYIALLKLIPILADTATVLLVYRLSSRELLWKQATFLSLLVLLNPAYILNSVFWGQIDGLYTLIIFWLIWSVYKKRYMQAVLAFTAGILTKPQMIIFLPLLGFWILLDTITELRETGKSPSLLYALKGLLLSCLLVFVSAVPIFGLDVKRFIALYTDAAGQYPYASLNAANFFGAFGLNWADINGTFLGISYQNWGFIGIILTSLFVGLGTIFSQNRSGVLILGGFTVMGIYMTAHIMHERYLFALVLILLVTYIVTKDKRMLFAFCGISVLTFVQNGVVLLNNEGIISLSEGGFIALSWIHILFF